MFGCDKDEFYQSDRSIIEQLELKFKTAYLRDFACSWILYTIVANQGAVEFSISTLEETYLNLIENKKLSRRYSSLPFFGVLPWLEIQLKTSQEPHVQFYLM